MKASFLIFRNFQIRVTYWFSFRQLADGIGYKWIILDQRKAPPQSSSIYL